MILLRPYIQNPSSNFSLFPIFATVRYRRNFHRALFRPIRANFSLRNNEIIFRLDRFNFTTSTQQFTTKVFYNINKPEIEIMSLKAMINELKSYGVDTKSLYEKNDVILAIQKARDDQLLPKISATNAMKYDLQQNHSITNIDKYLERKELESAFLQHCTSIRSNIEGIVINELTDIDTPNENDTGDDDEGNNNTQETNEDDTISKNNAIDETRKARTELIYQELIRSCEQMSIPEMHTELEQQLFVSPFLLLKCCVAIARIDGIVDIPINNDDSRTNQKTRLFPTELWKSIKVQDIVAESFIDKADKRKLILLPSYCDSNHQNKVDGGDGTTTLESRRIRIQEEMKSLDSISMKNQFHELEDTWGISPRCIYVCTIAVLSVLNVMVKQHQTDDALEDPDVRDMVEEAMANPKIDTLLSQAIMQPHIRNMVIEYIRNPQKFRNNETMSNDPIIQQILNNPVWIEQLQQMNIPTDDHTSTSHKS
jgi:hypothetical protein